MCGVVGSQTHCWVMRHQPDRMLWCVVGGVTKPGSEIARVCVWLMGLGVVVV